MENMTKEQKIKIKKARAEYQKKWRERNPEKQREYMDRYWLRKFERENG